MKKTSQEIINENEESTFNYKDHELIKEYQKRRDEQFTEEIKTKSSEPMNKTK